MVDLEQARREEIRWCIIRTTYVGRPYAVKDTILLRTLNDDRLAVTPTELRKELDYLRDRGLLIIFDEDTPSWKADLTRLGVDLYEYAIPCEPGIARPPQR